MNRGMSVYKSFCFWRLRAVHSKVWRQLNLKARLILNHLWQLATSGGACGPRSAAESSCPSHLSCCHGLMKFDATSEVDLNHRYCRFPLRVQVLLMRWFLKDGWLPTLIFMASELSTTIFLQFIEPRVHRISVVDCPLPPLGSLTSHSFLY
jgi:hypothetical protein